MTSKFIISTSKKTHINKISRALIIVLLIFVIGKLQSQTVLDKKITLKTNNQDIISTLKLMSKNNHIVFSYQSDIFPSNVKLTLSEVNTSVKLVLQKILLPNHFNFQFANNQIIIKKNKESKSIIENQSSKSVIIRNVVYDTVRINVIDTVKFIKYDTLITRLTITKHDSSFISKPPAIIKVPVHKQFIGIQFSPLILSGNATFATNSTASFSSQPGSGIGVNYTHNLTKSFNLVLSANYTKFLNQLNNNSTKTLNDTVTESVIIGYIQKFINGAWINIPVTENQSKIISSIINNNSNLQNQIDYLHLCGQLQFSIEKKSFEYFITAGVSANLVVNQLYNSIEKGDLTTISNVYINKLTPSAIMGIGFNYKLNSKLKLQSSISYFYQMIPTYKLNSNIDSSPSSLHLSIGFLHII